MQTKTAPIGYWIKKADNALTKGIDEIQSVFGLTRTGWQVLNSIKEKGSLNKTELVSRMQPFADENSLNYILTDFTIRELLEDGSGQLSLTEKGILLHQSCFEKQTEFRKKAMAGISEQQYQETVLIL